MLNAVSIYFLVDYLLLLKETHENGGLFLDNPLCNKSLSKHMPTCANHAEKKNYSLRFKI